MAILHKATVSPTKPELVGDWLDRQPWAAKGETQVVGAYRFDDPEGEVGVEAMIVRRGEQLLHVPLAYRGAELPSGELICTMEHSVLGKRWVYDATSDPVALGCYVRALRGHQEQASLEVYDGDQLVERREPTVRLRREGKALGSEDSYDSGGEVHLQLASVLGGPLDGSPKLIATWQGGEAIVAVLAD